MALSTRRHAHVTGHMGVSINEQSRENNLAAVPVFPAQVVRVYIAQTHSFVLVSSARSNRTHGMFSMHNMLFSDVLYVSQANCNSIVDSDEPDVKPYFPKQCFDGYGINVLKSSRISME